MTGKEREREGGGRGGERGGEGGGERGRRDIYLIDDTNIIIIMQF